MSDEKEREREQQERLETREWVESLQWVMEAQGKERVRRLLSDLENHAQRAGAEIPFSADTPHINTIPPDEEPPYPGSRGWNAAVLEALARFEVQTADAVAAERPQPLG